MFCNRHRYLIEGAAELKLPNLRGNRGRSYRGELRKTHSVVLLHDNTDRQQRAFSSEGVNSVVNFTGLERRTGGAPLGPDPAAHAKCRARTLREIDCRPSPDCAAAVYVPNVADPFSRRVRVDALRPELPDGVRYEV